MIVVQAYLVNSAFVLAEVNCMYNGCFIERTGITNFDAEYRIVKP